MKKVILTTLLATMITVPVSATPTGLIAIPSTDFAAQGKLHMDIDTLSSHDGSATSYGLSYGFKNGEIGVDYLPDSDNDQAIFNFKLGLVDKENFKLVAGMQNVGSGLNNASLKYVVASTKASDGTRFSLGYGWGRDEVLAPDENMVLAGIDKQLSDKWWGAVDYISGDSGLGALSFGVSYAVAPNASVLVGYNIYNNNSIPDTFTTQVDFNF
ncbi:MAG: hypothetical protein AAGU23_02780 [Bacillota bacterium]|nr:hypothetical protein [Bacillota bacterium]